MKRNIKYSIEEKIYFVKEYLSGKHSMNAIAKHLDINGSTFEVWVRNYESMGTDGFYATTCKHYSTIEKEQAVLAYLSGEGSQRQICKKYKIRSIKQLQNWIKKYNGHEERKSFGTGGNSIMTKGRKTTFKERVEIVEYCLEHNHNYAETAEKYNISYQQARNYTVKYEDGGIDSLQDRRGKRKEADQMTEIEKLRAELKLEQAKRKRAEMEVALLKKLEEIERRRW